MTSKFVFSCFDNMQARKDMFESWVEGNKGDTEALFMDLRLIMEQATIFNVVNVPEQIEKYRKYLFNDSQVPDAPCTARQTSHAATMIASHAVNYFISHLTNISKKGNRFLPFFWEIFMPLDDISYVPEDMDNYEGIEEEERIIEADLQQERIEKERKDNIYDGEKISEDFHNDEIDDLPF